jgi:hypothetical protein
MEEIKVIDRFSKYMEEPMMRPTRALILLVFLVLTFTIIFQTSSCLVKVLT